MVWKKHYSLQCILVIWAVVSILSGLHAFPFNDYSSYCLSIFFDCEGNAPCNLLLLGIKTDAKGIQKFQETAAITGCILNCQSILRQLHRCAAHWFGRKRHRKTAWHFQARTICIQRPKPVQHRQCCKPTSCNPLPREAHCVCYLPAMCCV